MNCQKDRTVKLDNDEKNVLASKDDVEVEMIEKISGIYISDRSISTSSSESDVAQGNQDHNMSSSSSSSDDEADNLIKEPVENIPIKSNSSSSSEDTDSKNKIVPPNHVLSTDVFERSDIRDMKHDTVENVETKKGSNDEVTFGNR